MNFQIDILGSIVLYKNEPDQILNVVKSFYNTNLNVYLVIIDNSPTDDLKKYFYNYKIEYIHNPQNPGFGASHNIALMKSIKFNSKYHLVLNPDIYFDESTLFKIVSFMDVDKSIGQLMPKVLFPDNTFQFLCKKNPTLFDLFVRGFVPKYFSKVLIKRINSYTYQDSDFNACIYNIPYLSGCFMFFRTATLEKVGFFDEKFFMYLEDADITRRFLKISKTVYYPEATIYHHYSGLTHKRWKFKLITIKSAIIYFNKWGWFRSII